jgi:hypothetical protein
VAGIVTWFAPHQWGLLPLSVPLVGKAGSRREWLVLIPVSGYAMVGMCTTAVGALDQNQWGPVQALLLGLAG